MKKINRFIPLAKPSITNEEIEAVSEVARSGWWTTGPKVTCFEEWADKYLGGGRNPVALSSCTGGLFLALKAIGIVPGDEIIVPTWTFAATGHVVEWIGAKPVLCDIDPDTLNIDVNAAARLVTDKTKAIMPVHIAGWPCDLDAIFQLANSKGLRVIEDAAHAFGAEYNKKRIGSFGDICVFSFYATKNLSCGEGGMFVSGDKSLSERVRRLSYFGIDKKAHNRYRKEGNWRYDIIEMGYKFNMDSFQAALGLVQGKRVDAMNARRRAISQYYRDNLENIEFLKYNQYHTHSSHLFIILTPLSVNRDKLIEDLKEWNIGTNVHFIPLHLHTYYMKKNPPDSLPVASRMADRALSLPLYPSMSDSEVEYVTDVINYLLKS